MGYQKTHYYRYGNTNNCVEQTGWVPDGTYPHDQITNSYKSLFGRYGEPGGLDGHVSTWNSGEGQKLYGTIYEMVKQGGVSSGELADIQKNGKHTGLTTGGCPIKGCTDPNANNYNPSASVNDGSCTYSPPSVTLNANPTSIIKGNCINLSWSASGTGLYSASLTDVSNPNYSGSAQVCPTNTKTYSYTVCGSGGCSTASRKITVYIPPVVNISLNKQSVIAGNCATLSWNVSGDGDKIYWTSGNITNGNITSSETVCPSDTTTYCAYSTGLGGTSLVSCAKLIVYQIPIIDKFQVPEYIAYGQQAKIEYEVTYANISVEIEVIYNYNNGSVSKGTSSYTTSGTSELSGNNKTVGDIIDTEIVYDNFGPRSVTYVLTASGNGGTLIQSKTVEILIDETPDNPNIQQSDGKIKDEDPVFTPDIPPDETVLSDTYYINDIDIPIEIKSNFPIEVQVNGDGNWQKLREI